MVYFVCESCNETLKKAQVERHLYSCKNCWGVTCVDCNFTFEGDTFREHTSCVSEEQKYQGALFKAPKAKQKNRGVNEIWADAVLLAARNASTGVAPKPLCAHLVRMGDLGNVPRQEKKFKNFVKNSLRVFDDASVSKLWGYVDGVKNDISAQEKKGAAAGATGTATSVAVTVTEAAATAEESREEAAPKIELETEPADKSLRKGKKSQKRARQAEEAAQKNEKAEGSDGGSGTGKRPRGQQAGGAQPEEGGRAGDGGVDAALCKALGKAAVGIVKKAPNKRMAVKELVKQAAAAVITAMGEEGSSTSSNSSSSEHQPDGQQLRRALKQRLLKEGLRRLAVEGKVAVYSKEAKSQSTICGQG